MAGHPYILELESHCEWLPKYVDGLWKTVPEVDKALFALPSRLANTLNWLTNSPWAASVRRRCVDEILAWPGESLHQTSWGAEKVAGNVIELLAKAENFDPFPTWSKFYNLIGEYTKDLFSIRGEVLPESDAGSVIAPVSIPTRPLTDQDEIDIIALLTRVGHRLTLPPILAEFDAAGIIKAESTIKPKLARMVTGGHLTNRQDTRPHKGYGLPGWD